MLNTDQLRKNFYKLSNTEKQEYIFRLYKPLLEYMDGSIDFGFLYYEALDGDETGETYDIAFEKYISAIEKNEVEKSKIFDTMHQTLRKIQEMEKEDIEKDPWSGISNI